jgi:DNA invertase Pin-like site-specific DNA recombinase
MKAVIYARVSTDKQNYSEQIEVLTAWAHHKGLEVLKVYAENDTAWKAGHQSELQALVQDAYKRKFDTVLVWALDRLTREGALAILELTHKLKAFGGVRVLSYSESWTEAPGELGEVLYALTGWVARMESQRRSDRTKLGIQRKRRENGGAWGRPKGKKDNPNKKRKRRVTK